MQVAEYTSNADPYAHWTYQQHVYMSSWPAFDCVLASSSFAYSTYTGGRSKAELINPANYVNSAGDATYGWGANKCSESYAYVCELPQETAPCPEEPAGCHSPPPPPPPEEAPCEPPGAPAEPKACDNPPPPPPPGHALRPLMLSVAPLAARTTYR